MQMWESKKASNHAHPHTIRITIDYMTSMHLWTKSVSLRSDQ